MRKGKIRPARDKRQATANGVRFWFSDGHGNYMSGWAPSDFVVEELREKFEEGTGVRLPEVEQT